SALPPARRRAVVDACARHRLTSYGLRSLAPFDARYVGRYGGDQRARDGAYHQGTAWGWLLGPFALAHFNAYGDAARAREYLAPLADHLGDHGLGSIAEIFDGDAPFLPNGCIAQAWSVAETLDRKSTRLNSSHVSISYAVFCLKKKKPTRTTSSIHPRAPPCSIATADCWTPPYPYLPPESAASHSRPPCRPRAVRPPCPSLCCA